MPATEQTESAGQAGQIYLIVATAVGYRQQHWVTQQGNGFSSTFPTELPGKAKDGQLLNCGINHARVTNVRVGV